MKTAILWLSLLWLMALPLMGQDNPKLEVFGGYQFQDIGGNLGWQMGNPYNGWDASATYNINQHFGVQGDFSGSYHHGSYAATPEVAAEPYHTTIYTFAAGPVFNFDSKGKIKPFVHALIGGAHINTPVVWGGGGIADTYGSKSGLAMMFGGGADFKYKKNMALRLVQFDWIIYNSSSMGDLIGAEGRSDSSIFASNVRISTGIVFHF